MGKRDPLEGIANDIQQNKQLTSDGFCGLYDSLYYAMLSEYARNIWAPLKKKT